MIEYYKSFFGFGLLCRIHGSAAYRSLIPSTFGVALYQLFYYLYADQPEPALDHPAAVGVLVTSVSFIIIFRANYGYQRYWDAANAIHQMMSKWVTATNITAAFHYQSDHYEHLKPPTYFDNPQINFAGLSRRRYLVSADNKNTMSLYLEEKEKEQVATNNSPAVPSPSSPSSTTILEKKEITNAQQRRSAFRNSNTDSQTKLNLAAISINQTDATISPNQTIRKKLDMNRHNSCAHMHSTHLPSASATNRPRPQVHNFDHVSGSPQLDGGISSRPSLFLQELLHLVSLLNGVAFSTLRDVSSHDRAASPLCEHIPGSKFPDTEFKVSNTEAGKLFNLQNELKNTLKYWLYLDRTPEYCEAYNSIRPIPILGGVSDGEIAMLQQAHGPQAKQQLCFFWLMEFISREHLAGSTGAIGPPIISRIFQFYSDGDLGYNQARKTSFIPFPFPHAQISMLALVFLFPAIPLLAMEFVSNPWLGSFVTFSVLCCLFGLHEVARELENPFRNVPNELPLCTLQAMFNESLLQLCTGYHPDSFWSVKNNGKGVPQDEHNKVK